MLQVEVIPGGDDLKSRGRLLKDRERPFEQVDPFLDRDPREDVGLREDVGDRIPVGIVGAFALGEELLGDFVESARLRPGDEEIAPARFAA